MASKSVHQPYNTDAVKHFGFEEDPIYGVYSNSNIDEVIITDDCTTFERIEELFYKETIPGSKISNYKRAFVIPGCPVSLDRIKAAAKEHKVTITNDYEKADIIISHHEINRKFKNTESIHTSRMMYELWNYDYTDELDTRCPVVKQKINVILDDRIRELCNSYIYQLGYNTMLEGWAVTGLAMNLAYMIEQGEIEVLNINTLLNESGNKQVLTEELVADLTAWMDSRDSDNKEMVYKILPTIDYTKNHHLLWQLSQNIYSGIHSRDKDLNYWLDVSDASKMYYECAEDCLLRLDQEGVLSKEGFRYLEKIIRQEIRIDNRELYVFRVSVKREFKKYLI